MANAKPISSRTPNPAATPPATTTGAGHPPWAPAVASVALFALCGTSRADVAFIAFIHLNLLLLFWSGCRFERSPLGSVARDRARFAMVALSATLMSGFTWRMTALMTLGYTILAWVMDAAAVGSVYFVLYVLR